MKLNSIDTELIWLRIAIELKDKEILSIILSKERNMSVAERFLSNLLKKYGKHPVSPDGDGTWYPPQACRFLKLKNYIYSPYEKSIIVERTMQYINYRTECFDNHFPCRRINTN